jgi:hypothetical protein
MRPGAGGDTGPGTWTSLPRIAPFWALTTALLPRIRRRGWDRSQRLQRQHDPLRGEDSRGHAGKCAVIQISVHLLNERIWGASAATVSITAAFTLGEHPVVPAGVEQSGLSDGGLRVQFRDPEHDQPAGDLFGLCAYPAPA